MHLYIYGKYNLDKTTSHIDRPDEVLIQKKKKRGKSARCMPLNMVLGSAHTAPPKYPNQGALACSRASRSASFKYCL